MAAALAGSASAARDATVNEYGLPYPAPVTIAVAPSSVSSFLDERGPARARPGRCWQA